MVDSRTTDDGTSIRRRRECLTCSRRYTTYERIEEAPLMVVKRSGHREPFDRAKLVSGLMAAAKGRPLQLVDMERVAADIEESLRIEGMEVSSQLIGVRVLDRLRGLDHVAYLRFASVYKSFVDIVDFEREVGLLSKTTEPKSPAE